MKFQLYLCLLAFCSFLGLSAIEKLMLVNETGQDLYFRIRSRQDQHNILVLHPDRDELAAIHGTEETADKILYPVPGNPEVFLFKSNSVIGIPVDRLYNDLRIRGWQLTYTPTRDGRAVTSKRNVENSYVYSLLKKQELISWPGEMRVFSLKVKPGTGKGGFFIKDTDEFSRELKGEKYAFVIDLEATSFEEYVLE